MAATRALDLIETFEGLV